MAVSVGFEDRDRVVFSASEVTGALGDSITVLPLGVAFVGGIVVYLAAERVGPDADR